MEGPSSTAGKLIAQGAVLSLLVAKFAECDPKVVAELHEDLARMVENAIEHAASQAGNPPEVAKMLAGGIEQLDFIFRSAHGLSTRKANGA